LRPDEGIKRNFRHYRAGITQRNDEKGDHIIKIIENRLHLLEENPFTKARCLLLYTKRLNQQVLISRYCKNVM
jgi:hypothetical protein